MIAVQVLLAIHSAHTIQDIMINRQRSDPRYPRSPLSSRRRGVLSQRSNLVRAAEQPSFCSVAAVLLSTAPLPLAHCLLTNLVRFLRPLLPTPLE